MSWWAMTITHLGLYLAGVITMAVITIFYELVIAKHSRMGVYCDGCRRQLDDPTRCAVNNSVSAHLVTIDHAR